MLLLLFSMCVEMCKIFVAIDTQRREDVYFVLDLVTRGTLIGAAWLELVLVGAIAVQVELRSHVVVRAKGFRLIPVLGLPLLTPPTTDTVPLVVKTRHLLEHIGLMDLQVCFEHIKLWIHCHEKQ